jgi:hypothetical protein
MILNGQFPKLGGTGSGDMNSDTQDSACQSNWDTGQGQVKQCRGSQVPFQWANRQSNHSDPHWPTQTTLKDQGNVRSQWPGQGTAMFLSSLLDTDHANSCKYDSRCP